jgi:hypothetical protein
MSGCRTRLAGVLMLVSSACVPVLCAQDSARTATTPQPPRITAIRFVGANQLNQGDTLEAVHLRVGEPLGDTVDAIEKRIERHYSEEGYPFARVKATWDEASGALTIAIDEGLIDAVEFRGVDERTQREFASDFALRAGDVYNRSHATQALRALLRPTRGALEPGDRPFDLVDRNGQRVLLVNVHPRAARVRVFPDLGAREDWFTPVDGFVPSLGFGAAIFDRHHFNHSYVSGHLSFKTATDRAGYAFGFERPFFSGQRLYLGAEGHDLTATDDTWQVSPTEASLAAVGPHRSFRDYYRRRGVQVNAAWRPERRVELLLAWRGERQENLPDRSDFSFWNGDDRFRPNVAVRNGRLNAIVLGASIDGAGFDTESLDATYRRHQMDAPFGERLSIPDRAGRLPVWHVDWTSEVSTPDALGSDFDFRRHIVSARMRRVSHHQEFGARAIGGWSDGILPPQRTFALGGIGSVHGYQFKEAVGDAMTLLNLEYAVGWRQSLQLLGFFDAGRVTTRQPTLSPDARAWMKGIGFGVVLGDAIRIDFGYRLDAIPHSPQVLLRFGRTF